MVLQIYREQYSPSNKQNRSTFKYRYTFFLVNTEQVYNIRYTYIFMVIKTMVAYTPMYRRKCNSQPSQA